MKSLQELMKDRLQNPNQVQGYQAQVQRILDYHPIQAFLSQHPQVKSDQMLESNIGVFNEFMTQMKVYDRLPKGEEPSFLPHLVMGQQGVEITYRPTDKYLAAKKKEKMDRLLDNRMMSKDVKTASLKNFDHDSQDRQALMAAVLDFMEAYEAGKEDLQGLYISGRFGVGKTYLMGAMANKLVDLGHSVTMIHLPTFFSEIKEQINKAGTQTMIDSVKSVDVLIMDDIGAESLSDWIRDEVLAIILEHRMKENLPTFFTSNFNMKELTQHLGQNKQGVRDSIRGERLMQRIQYLAKEMTLSGKNRRMEGR